MIRILAALALCSCLALASAATAPEAGPGRARYIVTLTESPLATYRGGEKAPTGLALKATSAEANGRRRLDAHDSDSRAYLAHLDTRHGAFLAQAGSKLGRTAHATHRYRAVANGLALDLTPDEAAALAALPGVVQVAPDRNMKLLTDVGPAFIGATQLWGGNVPGVAANRGEGVVIGVIDTGLNFTHPSFAATGGDGYTHTNPRGQFYGQCTQSPGRCNTKLIGIHDFTSEGTQNGADLDGHGSHVAATAAGNATQATLNGNTVALSLAVSGVAPHANLVVYKACIEGEEGGTCPLSGLISALDQAVLDGVDVINYSIGGDGGDPWQALRGGGGTDQASAMLNVRAAGIVPVVAAGNAGPLEGSVSDPGNAPWVIAAANATHNRAFENALTGVSGAGVPQPVTFTGVGVTGELANAKIVSGADFGSEGCGQGTAEDFPPTGASNPWPPGTFQGEIVVCRRGVQARVTKGYNVRQAGGGGMILVNQAELGDSIVADDHYLPAVHIGYQAGQQLYALLAQAKALGGNLTGSITGLQPRTDLRGDLLSGSSGRGPVEPYGGWLKPNLTAPGTDIVAAAQTGNGLAVLSGTSMASPHIAGAAALVLAAHPNWTVSQVESALLTTGIDDVVLQDGTTPATPHDGGGGRAFVPGAVRAGLSFVTSTNSFKAQDPVLVDEVAANGVIVAGPAALNMPYLEYGHCLAQCTFTRTATDNGAGGSWTAELQLPAGATGTVTPSSFVLGQGAQRQLTIQINVSNPSLAGSWVYGSLVLVSGSGTASNARLPIAVYADPGQVPDSITLDLPSDAGYLEYSFTGLVRLANPRFKATELVPLRSDQRTAPADLTQSDPWDVGSTSGSGAYYFTVPLGNETGQGAASAPATLTASLHAQLTSLSARDADLFVGIDTNGDGKPNEGEALCKQQGPSGSETCTVSASYANGTSPPAAWFLVQSFQNGNTLRLEYAAATQDSGVAGTSKSYGRHGALRVTGPGQNEAGAPFNARFAWNAPGMLPGESWLSFLSIAATPEASPFGNIPVFLDASAALARQPVLLRGNGERVGLRLAANSAHERIAIDVPAGAASLRIDMSGTGEGDLYLAKSAGEPAAPAIGQAPPRAAAQGTSIHAGGATETITLNTPTLSAGRWYVTPVNSGAGIADVVVSATLTSAGPAPATNDALYYDPQRSGHGVFLSSGSGQWVVVWYTYLEDGTPAWYLGQGAAPAADQLTWSTPLLRYTWDGARALGTEVGFASIVRTDTDRITFDWLLNGSHGSEPMQRILGPAGCATVGGTPTDTSGLWYAPAHSGYGYNVLSFPNTELQVNYLYDAIGVPRWLLGQNGGGSEFALNQYTGFCPVCTFQSVASQPAGTLVRTYTNARQGHATATAPFKAPLPGAWGVDDATLKITRDIACPN